MIRKKKIAKQLKTDKRGEQFRIEPLSTMAVIRSNGYTIDGELKISWTKLRRLAKEINLALAIKETHDKQNCARQVQVMDTSKLTPIVVEQTTSLPLSSEVKQLTTLEKRLETCRNIYQLLKSEFPDLPKFRKSKVVIHSYKEKVIHHRNGWTETKMVGTCDGQMSSNYAHCHQDTNQICFQQKHLLNSTLWRLAVTTAHELAHTKIKSCRHCAKFRERNKKHVEFLKKCLINGRLQECWVESADDVVEDNA